MHACTHTHTHTHTHSHRYAYSQTHTNAHSSLICTLMCAYTFISSCLHAHIYTHTPAVTLANTCTPIRIYPYLCAHIYTHPDTHPDTHTLTTNTHKLMHSNLRFSGDSGFVEKTDAGWYGAGIYFSEYPAYSMDYIQGAERLLLCQVLPGKVSFPSLVVRSISTWIQIIKTERIKLWACSVIVIWTEAFHLPLFGQYVSIVPKTVDEILQVVSRHWALEVCNHWAEE